jgi:hypothetical protein
MEGAALDWLTVLDALGGGASAVMILGLALWGKGREKRTDALVDKLMDMSVQTTDAMNELSRSIERGSAR